MDFNNWQNNMKNNILTEGLTKGQKLVGFTCNTKVMKFKQACADAIDILLKEETEKKIDSILEKKFFEIGMRLRRVPADIFIRYLTDTILDVIDSHQRLYHAADEFDLYRRIVLSLSPSGDIGNCFYLVIEGPKKDPFYIRDVSNGIVPQGGPFFGIDFSRNGLRILGSTDNMALLLEDRAVIERTTRGRIE